MPILLEMSVTSSCYLSGPGLLKRPRTSNFLFCTRCMREKLISCSLIFQEHSCFRSLGTSYAPNIRERFILLGRHFDVPCIDRYPRNLAPKSASVADLTPHFNRLQAPDA